MIINYKYRSAKILEEVFPEGVKWTALVLEYDENVEDGNLESDTYELRNIRIKNIYASDIPERGRRKNGRFVIIEPEDSSDTALLKYKILGETGEHIERRAYIEEPLVEYRQKKMLFFVNGTVTLPFDDYITVTEVERGYLNLFRSGEFEGLQYNLFIPRDIDKKKRYPLVIFLEGSGAMGQDVRNALFQGTGGCIWASPELQKKCECFVLAPQFPGPVIVNDAYECREEVDKTERLIDFIISRYPVDQAGIYLTGQSMGCMAACELSARRPDAYASCLFVAGQWNPEVMKSLKENRMWIFVSEEDKKAFAGMNAIVQSLEMEGAHVSRYYWDAEEGNEKLEYLASEAKADDTDIKYTVFSGNSVLRNRYEKSALNIHQCTWWLVYGLKNVLSWFLELDM